MASFTASSICFSFKISRTEHLLCSATDQAHSPSSLKKLGFHCMAQQTAPPLLDFSGRPHNELPIPVLASSTSSLIDSGSLWRSSDASVQSSTQIEDIISSDSPGCLSVASLMEPVDEDLQILNKNLLTIVGSENPLLMAAAEQIFSAGGKRMRPALVLLASKATAELAGLKDINPQHRMLAEVIEMIHTASLIHDDVLDESAVRRGKETIHQLYGTRVAVLAGDFMFAQSSWYLACMENLQVIKLISQVIKDLASGEIKQASSLFDCDTTLEQYLDKSYYKTASLIAASTCSAAIFSGVEPDVCDKMFKYGLNLGLAFQIVDDILDFTQSTEELGKPAGSDLSKGNLTAPVLFSLKEDEELRRIIESEFIDDGSLDVAIARVRQGKGLDKARALAKEKGNEAKSCLECLSHGPYRSSLEGMVDYVLERLF